MSRLGGALRVSAVVLLLVNAGLVLYVLFRDEPERPHAARSPASSTASVERPAPVALEPPAPVAPKPARRSEPPAPPALRTLDDPFHKKPASDSPEEASAHGPLDALRLLVTAHDKKTKRPINGAWVTATQASWTLGPLFTVAGEAALGPVLSDVGSVDGLLWHARYEKTERFHVDIARTRTVDLALTLGRLGAFTGTIHDVRGGAPTNAQLRFRKKDLITEVGCGDFDQWHDGEFGYDVAPGRYSVEALAPGYLPSDEKSPIDVNEGAPATADFVLTPEGRFEGSIELPDGLPDVLGSADLALEVAPSGPFPETSFHERRLSLDEHGRFSLGGLAGGTYLVRLRGASQWTNVFVASGSTARGVQMSLAATRSGNATGGELSGLVHDAAGGPLEGVEVSVPRVNAVTDASGRFRVPGLVWGSCPVVVSKKGYRSVVLAFEITKGASSVSLDVRLVRS